MEEVLFFYQRICKLQLEIIFYHFIVKFLNNIPSCNLHKTVLIVYDCVNSYLYICYIYDI